MKLTYSVSFEDFRTLYRPFEVKAGKNAGYIGALIACGLIAALGVFLVSQGTQPEVGGFLIGLGAVAAVGVHVFDRRSVQSKKKKYEEGLAAAFRKLHCKDQRIFETDEKGFTTSCQCATVTRPWPELTGLTDAKNHLVLSAKGNIVILPKSAFHSGGEITELLALASSKLKHDQSALTRHFDFSLTRQDYRQAANLHIQSGGGWRALMKAGGRLLLFYAGLAFLWNAIKAGSQAALAGVAGATLVVTVAQLLSLRRKHYFGPLRVYFTGDGLQFQDPQSQSRVRWHDYIGYLESASLLLLYQNPRLYRIIPKRALGERNQDFIGLVKEKIRPFDYRNPERAEGELLPAQREKAQSNAAGS